MSVYKIIRCGVLMLVGVMLLVAPALAADESNLAARAVTWETEYNADNLEALAAMYTEDGCRLPPNMEAVQGRAAIAGQVQAGKEAGAAQVKVTVTEAESIGDMAYGRGTYELTGADGSHIDHGKWINVSKRVNGEWKIHCDSWNSNMPVPGSTPQ